MGNILQGVLLLLFYVLSLSAMFYAGMSVGELKGMCAAVKMIEDRRNEK